MASSRGLPGFLRRSLRVDYSEDEDEEDDEVLDEPKSAEEDAQTSESADPMNTVELEDANVEPLSAQNADADHADDQDDESPLASDPREPRSKDDHPPASLEPPLASQQEQSAAPSEQQNNASQNESNGNMDDVTLAAAQEIAASAANIEKTMMGRGLSDSWQSDPAPPRNNQPASPQKSYRESKFDKVMAAEVVNMAELRKMAWNGVPSAHRAQAWKILLGYLPTNEQRREASLQRKRAEYKDAMAQHYEIDDDSRTPQEQETLRQVLVDVPRTAPEVPLFRNDRVRRILSRLLYIWAMRHPASSYVQGINDLATPLLVAFLADYYNGADVLDGHVMNHLSEQRLDELEADVYWCLTNLLAGIQDHYTSDQPGVQRMVMRLEELVQRIDADLCQHLKDTGIEFLQFSFKWMNCLLLREFSLRCVVRLWDTYLSERDGFEDFHVYVCAAFLCQFSTQLQAMTFDELFGFMQGMPTANWGDTEIEMLLSQAYVLSTLFGGSDAHLSTNNR